MENHTSAEEPRGVPALDESHRVLDRQIAKSHRLVREGDLPAAARTLEGVSSQARDLAARFRQGSTG